MRAAQTGSTHPFGGKAFLDFIVEIAAGRWRIHEPPVNFFRHTRILVDAAVREFDFKHAVARVVTGRAQIARIESFTFHVTSSSSWRWPSHLAVTCVTAAFLF